MNDNDAQLVTILPFPYQDDLTNARLEKIHEEPGPDGRLDLVLDFQAFVLSGSPVMSGAGDRPAETLTGRYQPRRLRFHDVQELRRDGVLADLAAVPVEHGARALKGLLYWQARGERRHVLLQNSPQPANLYFVAAGCKAETHPHAGTTSAPVTITRDWAITPHLTPAQFPLPDMQTFPHGGDPITVFLDGHAVSDRLFVGGLACQGDSRPEVDAVLNLGEAPSRWTGDGEPHPANRWMQRGEGAVGMSLEQMRGEAGWVLERLWAGQRVLVHCVAGFNRSTTICCTVLVLLEGLSAEAALARVRQGHPWARPDSHHWLKLRWLARA